MRDRFDRDLDPMSAYIRIKNIDARSDLPHEADHMVADIARAYTRLARNPRYGLDVEILSQDDSEMMLKVSGQFAYGIFKNEYGMHKIRYMSGRKSEANILVEVIPLVEINSVGRDEFMNNLDIQTTRSSGAGGQSVQKNETAVRVVHTLTGIDATVSDE